MVVWDRLVIEINDILRATFLSKIGIHICCWNVEKYNNIRTITLKNVEMKLHFWKSQLIMEMNIKEEWNKIGLKLMLKWKMFSHRAVGDISKKFRHIN